MKKSVLSAVVTGLMMTPSVYAMDEGLSPAVEVEVPAVEICLPVEVDPAVAIDSPVEVVPEIAVDPPVDIDHEVVVVDPTVDVDSGIAVDFHVAIDPSVTGDGEVGGFPEKVECIDLTVDGNIPVDENGDPVIYYCMGGIVGGLDDPSGDNQGGNQEVTVPKGEEIDQSGVFVTALNNDVDSSQHNLENIQPNFRNAITDRGADSTAVPVAAGNDSPSPQLLNDEQRGAVRGLRNDEERAKPRAGFGKLLSRFSKPKSEIAQASATTTDKSLTTKLAEVDRMRDTAVRTGDEKMLAKADKLEKRLRAEAGKTSRIK